MTVEVRRIVDGTPRHCVVGHQASLPSEVIHWNGCETIVLPGEAFEAAEAGDLFVGYYQTARIPPQYTLRVLDV